MELKKRGEFSGKTIATLVVIAVILLIVGAVFLFKIKFSERPDSLTEQCQFACSSGQKTAFCDVERSVTNNIALSCNDLATNPQYKNYNVQQCPEISCVEVVVDTSCVGLGGAWATPNSEQKCPAQEGKFVRQRNSTDSAPSSGQVCCYYYE